MPPKVVYGKKKSTARSQTNFTKFFSPEKAAVTAGQSPVSVPGLNWRRQLEDAAREAEKDNGGDDDVDLAALERGLGGLRIEAPAEENAVKPKKKNGSRKGHKANKSKEAAALIEDTLERSMGALTIEKRAHEGGDTHKKTSRPRKVLEDRDANAVKEVDCKKTGHSKDRKLATADNTRGETKVRTPRRTPKSKKAAKSKHVSPQRKAQLPTPEATPEPDDFFYRYASPLLALSDRKNILAFEDWAKELEPHFEITKIAEASFSEVYRLSATSETNGVREESVLKVVALKTPPEVPLPCQSQTRAVRDREGQLEKELAERDETDQWKSHVPDVLSEVKLLQNLNHIPGFTVFRDMTIVQGRMSTSFNDAWKEWNKARPRGKKSEFPDPSKKASYDDTQLWAVVEMQDAGTDCEKLMEFGGLKSIWEVWDVFWGVCLSVAKAEEACKFEHRDLHMGNICVRSSRPADDLKQAMVKDPLRRKLRFTSLETTVIDYTLSRADMVSTVARQLSSVSAISNSTSSSKPDTHEIDVAYLDLNKDPALFEGDASQEYQYEIYRYMRGAALFNNPLQWEATPVSEPEPEPEIVLLTPRRKPKANTHIRFGSGDEAEEAPTPRRSPRKHTPTPNAARPQTPEPTPTPAPAPTLQLPEEDPDVWQRFHPQTNLVWAHFLLHKLLNHLHDHGATPDHLSPQQIAQHVELEAGTDAAKVKKKAVKLYKVLQRVSELLCPIALGREECLGSVKELVVLGIEERWLRVGDVEG